MALGMGTILGSFGLIATIEGWNAVAMLSFLGFMIICVGMSGFILNRIYNKKKSRPISRVDLRLSDLEIERMVESPGVLNLEQFEKERSIEFNFKYILVLELPKKAICMISKTQIEKEETVLQCPECQNYYLSKYLLGWLDKNSKCPICQFDLKTKKV